MAVSSSSVWQVGLARVDITPPLGVWLTGFAGRRQGAQGVLDPLYATALVVSNGEEQAAILSCDLLAIDSEDVLRVRRLANERTGIPVSNIMVHATHTHSGPLVASLRGFGERDSAYEDVLWRQCATAIALAQERMQPARITYGEAEAPIGINRREWRDGQVKIGERPDGPVETKAKVLGIWHVDDDQAPVGLVVSPSVHPVTLGGQNYLLSRDYPGQTAMRLERALPGSTCMMVIGPCGDVNPLNMGKPTPLKWMRRHGDVLAGGALKALASSKELAPGTIRAAEQAVAVPLQPLPARDVLQQQRDETYKRILESGQDVEHRLRHDAILGWTKDALAVLERDGEAPRTLRAELQALAIGELIFVALPFEAFTEYQNYAAEQLPTKQVLALGCTNGNFGYLPTADAFPEGGYEVTGSSVQYYRLQAFDPSAPLAVQEGLACLLAAFSA